MIEAVYTLSVHLFTHVLLSNLDSIYKPTIRVIRFTKVPQCRCHRISRGKPYVRENVGAKCRLLYHYGILIQSSYWSIWTRIVWTMLSWRYRLDLTNFSEENELTSYMTLYSITGCLKKHGNKNFLLRCDVTMKFTDISVECWSSIFRVDNGGNVFFLNVGKFLSDYEASHPRRQLLP